MTEPTKSESIATVTKLQALRGKIAAQPAHQRVLTNYISTVEARNTYSMPRPLHDIVDDFYNLFPNIIHVDGELYDQSGYTLIPITSPDHLERRILASNTVMLFDDKLPGATRFRIFYDYILLDSMNPRTYKTAVNYPMWPPRDDILCAYPEVPCENNGALDEFADWFCFASEQDRQLFIASVVTLFWSDKAGKIPVFVIQGENAAYDQDQETGKTSVIDAMELLVGKRGYLNAKTDDKTQGNDYHAYKLCTMMVMDNIRATNYGNEQLERNLTSVYISAHKFHKGANDLYNKFVHFMTGNSISLNKDLSSRSCGYHMRKPKKPDYNWAVKRDEWILNNRDRIYAHAGWFLMQPIQLGPECVTRCRQWEVHVLHKICIDLAPKLIATKESLAANDEPERLMEYLFSQLALYRKPHPGDSYGRPLNVESDMIFISSIMMERFYTESRNAKYELGNTRMAARTKAVCAALPFLKHSAAPVVLSTKMKPRGYLMNFDPARRGEGVYAILHTLREDKYVESHTLDRFLRPSYGFNV